MKRIGVISDVHADVHALRDALAQLAAASCDLVVCCGDIVDEGSAPEETIQILRDNECRCIRGNHDRWAVLRQTHQGTGTPPVPLSPGALGWLASLPVSEVLLAEGVRIAIWHGTPRSDLDGINPEDVTGSDVDRWLGQAEADVLIVGHTHIPCELTASGGGMIINPGALLREVPGQGPVPAAGTYGLLELPSRRFSVFRARDGARVDVVRRVTG